MPYHIPVWKTQRKTKTRRTRREAWDIADEVIIILGLIGEVRVVFLWRREDVDGRCYARECEVVKLDKCRSTAMEHQVSATIGQECVCVRRASSE